MSEGQVGERSSEPRGEPSIQRVSTIELFFDLVFVFAMTQLTAVVAHPHGAADYAKAALVFFTLMWMYEGYAWLTSNVRVTSNRDCWLLVAAMSAFMVMSLAIPTVFTTGGVLYGSGLIAVVIIHALLFREAPNSSSRAILRLLPYQLGMAGLVLLAGFIPSPFKWGAWLAAVAMPILLTYHRRENGFEISSPHFVERHGLLMMIALGESIVGVGQSVGNARLDAALLIYAVLAIYLGICIWASYFDEDDKKAEAAIERVGPERRARVALLGFNFAHVVMIAGILLTAAGLEGAVTRSLSPSTAISAGDLGTGMFLYLLGDIAYRRIMDIHPNRRRAGIAFGFLLTVPIGLYINGMAQLVACGLLGTLLWTIEECDAIPDTP